MIICLLGTNPYDFSRLAKAVDNLAKNLNEEVYIQLGNTKFKPQYAKYFYFISKNELEELIKKADLVITQGGYGSITDALVFNKKIIAVPRLKELKEAQDDQTELVKYYASKGYIKACFDITNLEKLVRDIINKKIKFRPYEKNNLKKISNIIKEFINET
jgi:UDP-N-acetylglucosamine transferase subunit ALG13